MTVGLTLVVLAKAPAPGLVKTRLTPAYTPVEAARLAAAALGDTLDAVAAAEAERRLLVIGGDKPVIRRPGFEVVPQQGDGLDERLAHALGLARGPVLLLGMDTPQVTPDLLRLDPPSGDAWMGPSVDGGFWALGFAGPPDPDLLRGVPMSRADTCARQRERLVAAGLVVAELPALRDVDTAADVEAVACLAPRSRFATLARRLGPRTGATPEAREAS